MPLFSEHISNMYYSGSPSYSSPYGSYSSVTPHGSSYSASYLNPGGSYSTHSSLGGYSRTSPLPRPSPVSSRWVTSSGRNYAPMLSTITERGTSSPVRISSPRRIPYTNRTYATPSYTPRPININTADIDVSKDKYRNKHEHDAPAPAALEPDNDSGPFMPRVDGKPETGIDSSPGIQRSTIRRGRTVVRLHTVKRKDKDSPRMSQSKDNTTSGEQTSENISGDSEQNETSLGWREKLSEDLTYKDKKEKKTIGAKLIEKFIVKDKDSDSEGSYKEKRKKVESVAIAQNAPLSPLPVSSSSYSRSPDRRCSIEMLAEQAQVLDTLIRGENLSIAHLDLSQVGVSEQGEIQRHPSIKRRKSNDQNSPLQTTKSDHSLHQNLKFKDAKNFSKKRSLKKSSSGGSICRLDSITELPKIDPSTSDLPAIEEIRTSIKRDSVKQKPKPKLKAIITSSVEISPPMSPLKFKVDVTVEENPVTPKIQKKEIIYSSTVEDSKQIEQPVVEITENILKIDKRPRKYTKQKSRILIGEGGDASPEPDDGNFWDKIGKRETVYLIKRKQIIDEELEKSRRAFMWFPEEEEAEISNMTDTNKDDSLIVNNGSNADNKGETSTTYELIPNKKGNKDTATTRTIGDKQFSTDEIKNGTELNILKEDVNTDTKPDNSFVEKDSKQSYEVTIDAKQNSAVEAKDSKKSNDIKMDAKPNSVIVEKDPKLSNEIKIDAKPTSAIEVKDSKQSNEVKIDAKPVKSIVVKDTKQSNEIDTNQNNGIVTKDSKKSKELDENPVNGTVAKDLKKSNEPKLDAAVENSIAIEDLEFKTENKVSPPKEIIEKPFQISNVGEKKEPEVTEIIMTQAADASKHETINENKPVDVQMLQTPIENKITNVLKSEGSENKKDLITEESKSKFKSEIDKASKQNIIPASNNDFVSKVQPASKISGQINNENVLNETCPSCGGKVEDEPSNDQKMCVESNKPEQNVEKLEIDKTKKILETNKINKLPEKNIPEVNNVPNKLEKKISPPGKKLVMDKKPTESKTPILIKDNKPTGKTSPDKINKSNPEKKTSLPKSKGNKKGTETSPKASKSQDKKTCKTTQQAEQKATEVDPEITPIEKGSSFKSKNIEATKESKSENCINKEPESPKSPDVPIVIESENIPEKKVDIESSKPEPIQENKLESDKKVECLPLTLVKLEPPSPCQPEVTKAPSPRRPVKEEPMLRPLIATPRPLQKKIPQVIHSSSSSESSSEEESSEDEDADESDASEGSTEFFECETQPDGRTSTGSNDSGFDSSAPTSPAGFLHIKKGGDSAGTSGATPAQGDTKDLVEHELEQSTAYGLFRRTGRFTPPARSIPRFRKYTIEDFHFIKVLGKGSFGKVMLAELRDTEYYYAVKCLKKDVVLEDDDVECTLIERKVLALGTNHPYLCHLFATFQTDCHLFFVMEYLNGGDLMFHIQQSGRFPEARARFYAAEIVSGLKFLHKRGIVYRDLKLDNILLDFDGHVRIADFGMCKLQIYLDKTADTFCGTPDYMAPEIIKGLKYNQTVDWWSFGVLLYEMLIGQSPFSGCDEDELFWSICNEIPSFPRFLSTEALTILTRLLDKDMATRLGGTECMHGDVRDQDFFHAIHWDRLERRELEAPFRPRVRHPLDTQYFDRAFTGERPRLTAVEPQVLRSMDQAPFRGFSYTNPNATDR